jgi:hypothetical protein
MDLESLASLGVLVANAIFVIVAVAAYLRMNSHEESRQRYLSHALRDSREAGIALKGVARDLQRLLERLERGTDWRRQPLGGTSGARGHADAEIDEFEEGAFERLSPPEQAPAAEAYGEWRRLQQVELARLLQQRRQLLQALEAARAQNAQQAAAARSRGRQQQDQQALTDQAQRLRQQIEELQGQLQRSLVEKDFIEERLLALDAAERQARAAAAQATADSAEPEIVAATVAEAQA